MKCQNPSRACFAIDRLRTERCLISSEYTEERGKEGREKRRSLHPGVMGLASCGIDIGACPHASKTLTTVSVAVPIVIFICMSITWWSCSILANE